ncbi:fasciclin-like arabinogalactan protein 17 [Miscanthus floridulus]|uniref:fasciclin-like arabinogalactan protein 17 n=1 Tax=Miscanthus floridulus TaxID=154761 RepID=UPI00345879D5
MTARHRAGAPVGRAAAAQLADFFDVAAGSGVGGVLAALLFAFGVNSNSVLVALRDSHYAELAELVEKALLLHTLDDAVGKHNVTMFAPRNEALERDLDPEFKRFLLEPRNLKSLQALLLYHVLPSRLAPDA